MNERANTSQKQRMSLLGVQSILVGLILLAAMALHLLGGTVYEQLKTAFHRAVTDDSFGQVLSQAWEDDGD